MVLSLEDMLPISNNACSTHMPVYYTNWVWISSLYITILNTVIKIGGILGEFRPQHAALSHKYWKDFKTDKPRFGYLLCPLLLGSWASVRFNSHLYKLGMRKITTTNKQEVLLHPQNTSSCHLIPIISPWVGQLPHPFYKGRHGGSERLRPPVADAKITWRQPGDVLHTLPGNSYCCCRHHRHWPPSQNCPFNTLVQVYAHFLEHTLVTLLLPPSQHISLSFSFPFLCETSLSCLGARQLMSMKQKCNIYSSASHSSSKRHLLS